MWSQMGQQQHALKELAETFTVHRLRMPGFYAKGWPTNAIESLNSPFHPHAQNVKQNMERLCEITVPMNPRRLLHVPKRLFHRSRVTVCGNKFGGWPLRVFSKENGFPQSI